jgi:hypothetical protein
VREAQVCQLLWEQDGRAKEFDPEATYENLRQPLLDEDWLETDVTQLLECSDPQEVYALVENTISDVWEYISYRPTFHILWCLYAIRWAIQQYDKANGGKVESESA